MYFFPKYVFLEKTRFLPKNAPVTLHIPKEFGGIRFSKPQQFSESENFGPLGAGGGGAR